MNKCVIILPYYGRFPNYFQLFLNSCGMNADYDWLIFTDDRTPYVYPANVTVHYESFADMQARVRGTFDFAPELPNPYKLCDLRPMYGYLFRDYVHGYEFWGHCDCDLIFGKLDHFITRDMLDRYDKLFPVGHLALYRNTEENNRRFMLPLDGRNLYREVLESSDGFTFDESYLSTNINRIYQTYGFPIYMRDRSGNVSSRSTSIRLTRYDDELDMFLTEPYLRAVYEWDNGTLRRSFVRLGTFERQELMYLHFQRRRMRVDCDMNASRFQILPNSFEPMPVERVTADNVRTVRWRRRSDEVRHHIAMVAGDARFWWNRLRTAAGRSCRGRRHDDC
ncbi:hypothetical protein DSM100688_0221 [Bifidobacterium ramosum]|uniref:Uncharacterized protein n=1 Tax=Bifidobacterium ramosum TaxID=1798158 RepID=A0A6L4X2C1_9BIFI|nr:DUF6625 family protein [Bifidobacterium ramosum]KAB8289141.1 hypothetical protein DSM100688_0221 [Bifidobacterium ramosum]NEG70852.1 hypothetical protein [Bifidobacterium ramosum]